MSEKQKMALKAAAYALAAELGVNAAIEELRKVAAELENGRWAGPGNQ